MDNTTELPTPPSVEGQTEIQDQDFKLSGENTRFIGGLPEGQEKLREIKRILGGLLEEDKGLSKVKQEGEKSGDNAYTDEEINRSINAGVDMAKKKQFKVETLVAGGGSKTGLVLLLYGLGAMRIIQGDTTEATSAFEQIAKLEGRSLEKFIEENKSLPNIFQ